MTVAVISSLGLFVLLVVFIILGGVDLFLSSRPNTTEHSDLSIHGLEKFVLFKVVVTLGVHCVVGLSDF